MSSQRTKKTSRFIEVNSITSSELLTRYSGTSTAAEKQIMYLYAKGDVAHTALWSTSKMGVDPICSLSKPRPLPCESTSASRLGGNNGIT